jgi:hypothetical protein
MGVVPLHRVNMFFLYGGVAVAVFCHASMYTHTENPKFGLEPSLSEVTVVA